jgi:hypothetical protein
MNTAKNEAEIANAAICAPVKERSRNRPSGSIGAAARRSTATNAPSSTTAPVPKATMNALVQPSSFPRRSASTSANRPPISRNWPAQSSPRAAGSRDSTTYRSVAQMQNSPIGMLTKKIQRQSSPLVSAPPTSGPTAKEAPIVAP